MAQNIFLGVDQTGAVDSKGKPRPLPACSIVGTEISFFYLPEFSKKQIFDHLKPTKNQNVEICLDCVIGLPKELNMSWRQALRQISADSGYGRAAAKTYFDLLGRGQIYRRKVEIECGANSVFKEKPFQKNIQTGTFRFWKDISVSEHDFHAPFLKERPKNRSLPIYEGYPSLSWKLIFGTKNRTPDLLPSLLKEHFPELSVSSPHKALLKKDVNLADAFVLAMTLKLLYSTHFLNCGNLHEGWILGHQPIQE